MSVSGRSVSTVVIAIPGVELRRQVTEYLAALGYACTPTPTLEAALDIVGEFYADLDLLITEVRLPEAQNAAVSIAAARPAMKALFLCSEPEYVAREFITDPAVAFLEKPFAWCELKRVAEGAIEG